MQPTEKGDSSAIEIVIAIVISAAGLTTSWASYQIALWEGEQTVHYSLATAYQESSSRLALESSAKRTIEVGLFGAWLDAKDAGNERLAGIYSRRFPDSMKPAFEDWLRHDPLTNPRAPATPFMLPSYRQTDIAQAQAQEARARAEFKMGTQANDTSDAFTRCGVLFAMAMFFGGIAQVFRGWSVRVGLTLIAAASCILGMVQMLGLPMLSMP
jgi:hypothetical protein